MIWVQSTSNKLWNVLPHKSLKDLLDTDYQENKMLLIFTVEVVILYKSIGIWKKEEFWTLLLSKKILIIKPMINF